MTTKRSWGYITLRIPADNVSERRLGFVIVDDAKRGQGLGKPLVNMAVDYAFRELVAICCLARIYKKKERCTQAAYRHCFEVRVPCFTIYRPGPGLRMRRPVRS